MSILREMMVHLKMMKTLIYLGHDVKEVMEMRLES